MDSIPFVDWNGNGIIDPDDIALSLAIAQETSDAEDEDDI